MLAENGLIYCLARDFHEDGCSKADRSVEDEDSALGVEAVVASLSGSLVELQHSRLNIRLLPNLTVA